MRSLRRGQEPSILPDLGRPDGRTGAVIIEHIGGLGMTGRSRLRSEARRNVFSGCASYSVVPSLMVPPAVVWWLPKLL